MKVAELIAELQKCRPDAEVKYYVDTAAALYDLREVGEVSDDDGDGNVVLGDDLPPEMYARHYKYERG